MTGRLPRRHIGAALLAAALLSASAAYGTATSLESFVATAGQADVVILGEIHDNPGHHRNQAEIVAALAPSAVVFEMIPRDRTADLERLRAQDASDDAIAEALGWEASGWPPFEMYAPILRAAPEARLVGAGVPFDEVRRAATEGAAAAFGAGAAAFGLDRALPAAEQSAREAEMAVSHCGLLPDEMLPGMVDAQRLRDARFAEAAIVAHAAAEEAGPVVVITGNGHADRDRGIPAMIAEAAPHLQVVTLGQYETPPGDGAPVDAYLLAPAPERGDPCASLMPADG